MKAVSPTLRLLLLAAICLSLAMFLQPQAVQWAGRAQSDSILKVFLGEGRRLFANHFFVQADVSFHSGYYPSIFDQARRNQKQSPMLTGDRDRDEHHDEHGHDEAAHEREMAFLAEPKDWIERFGRHFQITEHTHLANGKEREILPWLKLSAELDPQRIETYTTAAYWLRNRLGKVKEAEDFLREGLRNNPNSYELLFELGKLYRENRKDNARARNVWELALAKWSAQESGKKDPNLFDLEQITVNLSRLEEEEGNFPRAIGLLELAKKASPHPKDLDKQIEDIRKKMASGPQAK